MATKKSKETKFESILKGMCLSDKSEAMQALCKLEQLFKDNSGAKDDSEWFSILSSDEALKNIWIGANIASRMWFSEYKKSEEWQQLEVEATLG